MVEEVPCAYQGIDLNQRMGSQFQQLQQLQDSCQRTKQQLLIEQQCLLVLFAQIRMRYFSFLQNEYSLAFSSELTHAETIFVTILVVLLLLILTSKVPEQILLLFLQALFYSLSRLQSIYVYKHLSLSFLSVTILQEILHLCCLYEYLQLIFIHFYQAVELCQLH